MTPSQHRLLRDTWYRMIERCENPNGPRAHRYHGRGIRVCPKWRDSFDAFAADMGPRPAGMTLDRIDNNGDYEPGNCRWADAKTQIRNSTTAKVTEAEVREILRLVHVDGHEVHTLDLVFPLSPQQIRSIALGKSFRLDGYAYPPKLPRRSDAKKYREGRNPKLNPDSVRDIRKRYAEGQHVKEIAALHGISPSNAYNVALRHTWKYVS